MLSWICGYSLSLVTSYLDTLLPSTYRYLLVGHPKSQFSGRLEGGSPKTGGPPERKEGGNW